MLLLSSDVSGLEPRLLLMLQCLGWGGTARTAQSSPRGLCTQSWASSAGGLGSLWTCPGAGDVSWHQEAAGSGFHGWGGTGCPGKAQPLQSWGSSAGGLCSLGRCSWGRGCHLAPGGTAGVALVAQLSSHPTLVTLWFVQSVRAPPGHEFPGCSGMLHGAQLGPWCSAQLSSLKAASPVLSARVCQEHLCSFNHLAPCFFYFTPATTQAGSGSCWQMRTVTT